MHAARPLHAALSLFPIYSRGARAVLQVLHCRLLTSVRRR